MAPEAKSESFLVRMSPTEIRMLAELCEKTGLTRADVIRQMIRREHASLLGDGPARKRTKSK